MVALVVLSIGILAVAQLSAGSRGQVQDKMISTCQLLPPAEGRGAAQRGVVGHAAGCRAAPLVATDDEVPGAWRRHYEVQILAAPWTT
jgi:hypothetical protein